MPDYIHTNFFCTEKIWRIPNHKRDGQKKIHPAISSCNAPRAKILSCVSEPADFWILPSESSRETQSFLWIIFLCLSKKQQIPFSAVAKFSTCCPFPHQNWNKMQRSNNFMFEHTLHSNFLDLFTCLFELKWDFLQFWCQGAFHFCCC